MRERHNQDDYEEFPSNARMTDKKCADAGVPHFPSFSETF